MKKIYIWLRIAYESIKFNVGMALVRSEEEVFGMPDNLKDTDKKNQRMRHRNPVLEKFYAGKTNVDQLLDEINAVWVSAGKK